MPLVRGGLLALVQMLFRLLAPGFAAGFCLVRSAAGARGLLPAALELPALPHTLFAQRLLTFTKIIEVFVGLQFAARAQALLHVLSDIFRMRYHRRLVLRAPPVEKRGYPHVRPRGGA